VVLSFGFLTTTDETVAFGEPCPMERAGLDDGKRLDSALSGLFSLISAITAFSSSFLLATMVAAAILSSCESLIKITP